MITSMLSRRTLSAVPWLSCLGLLAVTWLAGSAIFGRWTWSAWSDPHWLEGDPLEVYARVRAVGDNGPTLPTAAIEPARLGAPFGADWSAYAVPDRLVFFLTARLGGIIGFMPAVQAASLAILALDALSFFLCARWLGRRWEWAAAFALGFAFCNYNLRWGITLSLSQTFVLPPLVLLFARSARPGPAPTRSRGWTWLAAGLGLWLGAANPYLAFFAGVVGGGSLILALIRRAPRARQQPLWVFLGSLTLTFLLCNLPAALANLHGPEAGVITRDTSDFTRYALRPIEWFVPPADHRWDWLARLGRHYHQIRNGDGEFFYNYLGLVGALGLAWLVLAQVQRRGGFGPARDPLLGLCWIVAFGTVGGVNFWLGALGVDWFRASTRMGVYAAVWAALFLSARLSRLTLTWPRPLVGFLAAALAAFLCWEQTPALADPAPRTAQIARWHDYQTLGKALEEALPPGAAVFQLPAVPFLEAGRTLGMPDYEHFLPFITTSSVRLSYGHLRTAAAYRWTRHVSRLSPATAVDTLQRAGFHALWLDPRGLPGGGDRWLRELASLGLPEIAAPSQLPVRIFRLRPDQAPVLPDLADPRLADPWGAEPATPGHPLWLALNGWYGLERDGSRAWRWAATQADLGLWLDGPARDATFEFSAGGRTTTTLRLELGGAAVWQSALRDGPPERHRVKLHLEPGLTTFRWVLSGETFHPPAPDLRELGFLIENPVLSAP